MKKPTKTKPRTAQTPADNKQRIDAFFRFVFDTVRAFPMPPTHKEPKRNVVYNPRSRHDFAVTFNDVQCYAVECELDKYLDDKNVPALVRSFMRETRLRRTLSGEIVRVNPFLDQAKRSLVLLDEELKNEVSVFIRLLEKAVHSAKVLPWYLRSDVQYEKILFLLTKIVHEKDKLENIRIASEVAPSVWKLYKNNHCTVSGLPKSAHECFGVPDMFFSWLNDAVYLARGDHADFDVIYYFANVVHENPWLIKALRYKKRLFGKLVELSSKVDQLSPDERLNASAEFFQAMDERFKLKQLDN